MGNAYPVGSIPPAKPTPVHPGGPPPRIYFTIFEEKQGKLRRVLYFVAYFVFNIS